MFSTLLKFFSLTLIIILSLIVRPSELSSPVTSFVDFRLKPGDAVSPNVWAPMLHTKVTVPNFSSPGVTCGSRCLVSSSSSDVEPCDTFVLLDGQCYLGKLTGSYSLISAASAVAGGALAAPFSKTGGKNKIVHAVWKAGS